MTIIIDNYLKTLGVFKDNESLPDETGFYPRSPEIYQARLLLVEC